MKKIFVLLLVACVSAALFAGGSQGASGGSGAAASSQPQEIRVLLANHAYTDQVLRAAIPEFEQQSGIKVNWEAVQEAQLTQKLTTEFATGASTVDVFMSRPLQEALLFNKNGWYAQLDGYDFSDYPANTVELGMKNGKPHLVPLVIEWQILYYRKDLFEKAGVKVPTNFTELEAAARTLTANGVAGIASRGAAAAAVTQMSSYIYNYGGTYLKNNVAAFDSPEAVEAIRYYGRLLGNYGPQGVTAMSWENLIPVFQAGRIAMWTDASSLAGNLMDQSKTQIPLANIGIAKLPSGPKADNPYLAVAWGMGISSKTRNMDNAMKFLTWATSKELMTRGMNANVTLARRSIWEDPAATGKMHPGLIETMKHASTNGNPLDRPFMTSVVKARDLIGEVIIESINSKGASPRIQAMATERAAGVNDLLRADGEYGN